MSNHYFQPQPWRTFTTPLTIPRPPSSSTTSSIHAEWLKLRADHRPHTPPSLSPSPAPSTASTASSHSHPALHCNNTNLEIEELDDSSDSGVDLLIGEYEEAPDNYRRRAYDADEDEDEDEDGLAASHSSIVYGFERLTARTRASSSPSPVRRAFAVAVPVPRRAKRCYAESEGSEQRSVSSWGDSGVESEEEEGARRRVRRRVVLGAARKLEEEEEECVSVRSWGSGACSDNEIDMEL